MPREITSTERDQNSRAAQLAMMVGDPNQWLRIDKGDGSVVPVNSVAVVRAAQGSFKCPNHAIATCRFTTKFAIYCTGDQLTDAEKELMR
jgi:hypothetical protein